MAKPIVNLENGEVVVSIKWLMAAVMAVDRISYSCGGLLTGINGSEAVAGIATKMMLMDEHELKSLKP